MPDVISIPYSLRRVRLTSRISISITTSARSLSSTSRMRSAAATLSGVSLMVSAFEPGSGATRRAPSTMRSRSIVSLRSAFDRKNVLTTCCSYSRRLVGVSGTTVTTCASVTRWNVRPVAASAESACSNAHVREVQAHGRVLELRVEDEVDARGLAERQVRVAQAGAAERQAEGLARRRPQHEAGQRALARALLDLLHGGGGRARLAQRLDLAQLGEQRRRPRLQVHREAHLLARVLVQAARRQAAGRARAPRPRAGGPAPGCAGTARCRARA